MAHFAEIVNGRVTNVIVVANEDAPTEAKGQAFIASIGLVGQYVQTSYNNNPVGEPPTSRGKYAGIGDIWNGAEFISTNEFIDNE